MSRPFSSPYQVQLDDAVVTVELTYSEVSALRRVAAALHAANEHQAQMRIVGPLNVSVSGGDAA